MKREIGKNGGADKYCYSAFFSISFFSVISSYLRVSAAAFLLVALF